MKTKSSKFFFLICLFLYNNNVFAQQSKEDTFNLVLCEKTIKDNLIGAILLIGISDNDSNVDSKLLKGKSINLNIKKEYGLLLIGKKKWNYYIELTKLTKLIQPTVRDLSLCFDASATFKRKRRFSDVSLSGNSQRIGSFSKRISKKGKVSRSITNVPAVECRCCTRLIDFPNKSLKPAPILKSRKRNTKKKAAYGLPLLFYRNKKAT